MAKNANLSGQVNTADLNVTNSLKFADTVTQANRDVYTKTETDGKYLQTVLVDGTTILGDGKTTALSAITGGVVPESLWERTKGTPEQGIKESNLETVTKVINGDNYN
jgi:hypothetical protein